MAESEAKRHAIAAAMKKLLRTSPIEKITTEQILAQSGVSRRSFYRYFKDKYDLLQWIYNYNLIIISSSDEQHKHLVCVAK